MNSSILMVTLTCAVVTIIIRFTPFVLIRKETPEWLEYLGKYLPYAVISMLVVYCLKDVSLFSGSHGLPEFLGIAIVAVLHLWKHNTLLSVIGGTVGYMLLVQFIF